MSILCIAFFLMATRGRLVKMSIPSLYSPDVPVGSIFTLKSSLLQYSVCEVNCCNIIITRLIWLWACKESSVISNSSVKKWQQPKHQTSSTYSVALIQNHHVGHFTWSDHSSVCFFYSLCTWVSTNFWTYYLRTLVWPLIIMYVIRNYSDAAAHHSSDEGSSRQYCLSPAVCQPGQCHMCGISMNNLPFR